MKKIYHTLLFALAISVTACTNRSNDPVEVSDKANENKIENNESNAPSEKDAEFLVAAASGGMMEVALGNAAQSKAVNLQVKNFASMMVRDHTKANDDLKTVATVRNLTIPTAMGESHQKMVDKLMEKNGAEFDEAYMDMMVSDHKNDISKFEDAAEDGKDQEIRSFALRTLPVLKTHLDSAIVILDDIKK